MKSDFDRAEFRRIIHELHMHNTLSVIKLLQPNQEFDEGTLRRACETAISFLEWFRKDLRDSIK